MENPVKVIWKVKNKHGKVNYLIASFVGVFGMQHQKIFKKIKSLNLFDTLITLSTTEIKQLDDHYGRYWYRKFHCTEHINSQINKIRSTKSKRDDLIDKYGEPWVKAHIDEYEYINRTSYNYGTIVKQTRDRKTRLAKLKDDDDIENNFTTSQSNQILNEKLLELENINEQEGGGKKSKKENTDEEIDITNYINEINTGIPRIYNIDDNTTNGITNAINASSTIKGGNTIFAGSDDSDEDIDEKYDDQYEEDIDGEDDVDDIYDTQIGDEEVLEDGETVEYDDIGAEMLYDIDENALKTNEQINNIIEDDISRAMNMSADFDDSINNIMHETLLKDSYLKVFVYNQYLFKDDTIFKIKQKITCGIQQDLKFGKAAPHILPSRMYLWAEYEYEHIEGMKKIIKPDKIMIGQKWMKRNEILNLDVDPNSNLAVYENLRGNLRSLKDGLLKYGSRIKREMNDTLVLEEYEDYITNNEIYMIDIYHELGSSYSASEEHIKNLYNVYVKIYYTISQEELKHIIDHLNNKSKTESTRIIQEYQTIENDLLMENRITNIFEELDKTKELYNNIFGENYITQAVIRVNLQHVNVMKSAKLDLGRIVDNFEMSEIYPFLQYQQIDGTYVFAFEKNKTEGDKNAIMAKWFETAPFGISFKIKVEQKGDSSNKYISVNLNENGQIDYKSQWKEEDKATTEDIISTYPHIRNLLMKINSENDKMQFVIPGPDKFKFAFINTIQQIIMPSKYQINHNEFSEFARLAYPYMAVVVEPRKRQSLSQVKGAEVSKAGFYGRFKRHSGYDDESKIEQRIVTILRNYEYVEKVIVAKLSEQFNITEKIALQAINTVKTKYPNLKKSRKFLKPLDSMPKYKPPGIDVNIQGKLVENYKARISGARSKKQLDSITIFMKKLLYLYIQIFKEKNKKFIGLKDELKHLNNIAKRRHKVEDIVAAAETQIKTVKQITKLDKERLAYKPGENQNQWTRNCQNSADKNRRPMPYTDANIEDMIKKGYNYNPKSGEYERKAKIKVGSKFKEIVLKAAQLKTADGSIYWTCSPEDNKEYTYVGFLSKSQNPGGLCAPCCFKKDQATARNKEKKDYYMKCVGKMQDQGQQQKKLGEKLYILQDSNKIQEGRFSYLPDYLDFYFNTMLNKTKKIKNSYLQSSNSGYFFKYGSVQNSFAYLNVISVMFDMPIDVLKQKIVEGLTTKNMDINMQRFTYLNNGDIRTRFGTIKSYLQFIQNSLELKHDIVDDAFAMPGILYENGVNIFLFEKRSIINTVSLSEGGKEMLEDYVLLCKYNENISEISDPKRLNVFILKENDSYFPILMAQKTDLSKNVTLTKTFEYKKDQNNLVNHILKYFKINCGKSSVEFLKVENAKVTSEKLYSLPKQYHPIKQIIDKRNKCKYLILQNNIMIPVKPSGTLLNIPLTETIELNTLEKSVAGLMEIYEKDNSINTKVQGFIYDYTNSKQKHDDNELDDERKATQQYEKDTKYHVIAIMVDQGINLPIQPVDIKYHELHKIANANNIKYFYMESRSLYDKIDDELAKGSSNVIIDDRILNVNKAMYDSESYDLFRLELSYYLDNHPELKKKIDQIVSNEKMDKIAKKEKLKKHMYKISNKEMYEFYLNVTQDNDSDSSDKEMEKEYYGGATDINVIPDDALKSKAQNTFVNLMDDDIDIKQFENYELQNNRDLCKTNLDKKKCNANMHCWWYTGSCKLQLSKKNLALFINKVIDEMVTNKAKYNEIMQKDNYYVPDIIDPNRFKDMPNKKIIKSINPNIHKVLEEIFGKNNIPQIGKNRSNRQLKTMTDSVLNNPLEKLGNVYSQVVNNTNGVFRAYANCFYWLKNEFAETSYRNIGYYSILQSDLVNLFKSFIVDYLLNKKRTRKMINDVSHIVKFTEDTLNTYLSNFVKTTTPRYIALIDLYILNQIHHIPIVLYNVYDQPFVIINNGFKYCRLENITIGDKPVLDSHSEPQKYINIKYAINSASLNSSIGSINALYFI